MVFSSFYRYFLGSLFILSTLAYLTYSFSPKKKLSPIAFLDTTATSIIESRIKRLSEENKTVIDALQADLETEYQKGLAALQQEFNIPPKDWNAVINILTTLEEKDDLISPNPIKSNIQAIQNPFIKKLYKVLEEYSINPSRIKIEYVDSPGSFISAGQGYFDKKVTHVLRLNMKVIEQRTQDIQEAFLRHEIIHLLHYDGLELLFIKELLEQHGVKENVYLKNPAFIEYKKFKEYRADLLAANSVAIAESFLKDFANMIKLRPNEQINPTHTSHPTEAQRYNAMSSLHAHLQTEQTLLT